MLSLAALQLDWVTIAAGLGMVVLVVLARILMRGAPPPDVHAWTREEMLKRSYAAGEIDRKTYLRLRRELRG